MDFAALVEALRAWAAPRDDVRGIAVVGSYARGTARAGSDVDVLVLTAEPGRYLEAHDWLSDFGRVVRWQREDWGAVQSLRTSYEDGTETEFGVASVSWADVPPDPGTREVAEGGLRVVFERDELLSRLVAAIGGAGQRVSGEEADARDRGVG